MNTVDEMIRLDFVKLGKIIHFKVNDNSEGHRDWIERLDPNQDFEDAIHGFFVNGHLVFLQGSCDRISDEDLIGECIGDIIKKLAEEQKQDGIVLVHSGLVINSSRTGWKTDKTIYTVSYMCNPFNFIVEDYDFEKFKRLIDSM